MASTTYRNSTLYRNSRLYRGTFTPDAGSTQETRSGGAARDVRRYHAKERKRRARDEERDRVIEATPATVEPSQAPAETAAPIAVQQPSAPEFAAVVAKIVEAGLPPPAAERSVFDPKPGEEQARAQARAEVEAIYLREREAEIQRLIAEEQAAQAQREADEHLARLRREDEELMLIIDQFELV